MVVLVMIIVRKRTIRLKMKAKVADDGRDIDTRHVALVSQKMYSCMDKLIDV